MPRDLIDEYLDIDFRRCPQYVPGAMGIRGARTFANFEDTVDLIPKTRWKELIEQLDQAGGGSDQLVTRIYYQGREGSCVANACSQAHEVRQAVQFGRDRVVHLSAISLYKRIGRSPNSGAMVDDGLEEMHERGILPLDTPDNRRRFGDCVMPNTGFYTNFPNGWEHTARLFRADEWTVVRSLEGMMTALLLQFPVVVGRQGHSICYLRPMYRNGSLITKYANSWHQSWGDGGFGYDSLSQMRMSSSWAFALRSVSVP